MTNENITYEISIEDIKKIVKRRKDQDYYMDDGTLIKVWSTEEKE